VGHVRRGTRQEVAYYDQQRAQLDLDLPVAHNINARSDFVMVGGQNRHISGYLRDFLFRPDQLMTPARALSGGERNRLLLARLFAQPANLLVLDEPTNDLDIDTLELLQELVADFSGTLLLVSHDRAFLDSVVTSLLVLQGDGAVRDFVGGYSDWVRWRDERNASAARGGASRRGAERQPEPARAATPARRKLSYKDQRELTELPARLETLEQRKQQLTTETQDPKFYSRPRTEVAAQLQALAALDVEIEKAFARWSELEGA
jgi:ATP-binding cassette subfamily F protein uup